MYIDSLLLLLLFFFFLLWYFVSFYVLVFNICFNIYTFMHMYMYNIAIETKVVLLFAFCFYCNAIFQNVMLINLSY